MAAGRGGRCVTGGKCGVGVKAEVALAWFREALVFGGGSYANVELLFAKLARRVRRIVRRAEKAWR